MACGMSGLKDKRSSARSREHILGKSVAYAKAVGSGSKTRADLVVRGKVL